MGAIRRGKWPCWGAVYLHVFDRDDEELTYCGIRNTVRGARLIAPEERELTVTQSDGRITIGNLSGARQSPLGYIIELHIDGSPEPLLSGHRDLNF